jgi:tetratricopeptide (TPR) repeat protein
MAEEILNALSRIDGLTVAGRTSSFSFKGKEVDLKSIGRTLGVAHILEGSVRKQGERVRITAKLARARDGVQEWSHEYDGTLADIFGLQESIARDIAGQLKIVLADTSVRLAPKATGSSQAYLRFVEAQDLLSRREGLPRAIELLTQATNLDPAFARAWSKLAVANAIAPMYSSLSWPAGNAAGEAAARRALALDPGSAEAYAALGFIYLSQHRYLAMDGAFDEALRLDPSDPVALFWAANGLASTGRLDAAEVLIDRILKNDPVNPTAMQYKSMLRLGDEDLAGAVQAADRGVALGFKPAGIFGAIAVAQGGDPARAAAAFSASWGAFNTAFTPQELVAIFTGTYGSAPERAAAVALVEQRIADPLAPTMFIFLREPQKAFGTFERFNNGIADAFMGFLWMPADWSRYARQHPSFQGFARRMGMLEYWRKAGWPDRCQPAPAHGPDAFECK